MSLRVGVIGGGIAGVAASYFIAASGDCDQVTLLEAESQLAQHSTGRSAAIQSESYGDETTRALKAASLDFLHRPPDGLADGPWLEPRGVMTVATNPAGSERLDALLRSTRVATRPIDEITIERAAELAPHVRFGEEHRVMWEEHAFDIDVAALHQGFVRGLRSHGGQVATSNRVDAARSDGDGWVLSTTQGDVSVDVVVNAAGAWGDLVAAAAGIPVVGLEARRRTAFMVKSPFESSSSFPLVADATTDWYVRPDGLQFMCSPADEVPSDPCDARPEEIDIARAIDVLNEHTRLDIRSVASSWAGLRTFAPDRVMVIGPEPGRDNFIWCVGQGGTGIQTAPAVGRLVASLVSGKQPEFDLAPFLPSRFKIGSEC